MDKVNKLIRDYVKREYPQFNVQDSDIVEILRETESGGFCDTCYYEIECWKIRVNGNPVHTFYDDLASVLNQILE